MGVGCPSRTCMPAFREMGWRAQLATPDVSARGNRDHQQRTSVHRSKRMVVRQALPKHAIRAGAAWISSLSERLVAPAMVAYPDCGFAVGAPGRGNRAVLVLMGKRHANLHPFCGLPLRGQSRRGWCEECQAPTATHDRRPHRAGFRPPTFWFGLAKPEAVKTRRLMVRQAATRKSGPDLSRVRDFSQQRRCAPIRSFKNPWSETKNSRVTPSDRQPAAPRNRR